MRSPVRQGIEVFGAGNAGFWYLADALRAGASFPEPILVDADEHASLVVLEGRVRLTGYFLRPEYLPEPLLVLIGLSPYTDK